MTLHKLYCLCLLLVPVAHFTLAMDGMNVPVMLWCGECENDSINPLSKISTHQFQDKLSKLFSQNQPPIVVFINNNFCLDNIKMNKKNLQEMNIFKSEVNLTLMTSVDSPLSGFNSLPYKIQNTTIKNINLSNGELVFITINDLSSISEKYSIIKDSNPNVVIALTGKFCYFLDSMKRSKRAVDLISSKPVENILFHIDDYPYIKVAKNGYTHIGNETNREVNIDANTYNLTLEYKNYDDQSSSRLKAHFVKFLGYFKLLGIEYTQMNNSSSVFYLKSRNIIEFPEEFSYHCSESVFNYNPNLEGKKFEEKISIKLLNLQVAINTDKFSEYVYDCVGFMSISIWTGIFVTAILTIIMIWSLLMIMDIRTMDRFDDPKGKFITVSTQE